MAHLGMAGTPFSEAQWTKQTLLTGLVNYADSVSASPADFRAEVQKFLDGRAAWLTRKVDRMGGILPR